VGFELVLAGRESSGRARSEGCGWRMARRVSCRDSWSADIVDMVCEVVVQDMAVGDGRGKSSSSEPRQKLPSEVRPDRCLLRAADGTMHCASCYSSDP
jgi:hypothetical protein